MLIKLSDGRTLYAIGDPHLGRKFEVGVSVARKGQREALQFRQFLSELEEDVDVNVSVGDIFDNPFVPYSVVDKTAKAYASAAERNPDTTYIVYAGNHDLSRNTTAVGAFHDLEQRLVDRYDNLHIVRRPTVITDIALMPWEWDRRADEQVSDIAEETAIAVFGHWDLMPFEGKDDHLAPVEALHKAFGKVPLFTGHYHVEGDYYVNDVLVRCTGSLQPFTHGEDPTSSLYVTMALSEALAKPEGYFKDKVLRVELAAGETLPEIDCLALTPKRARAIKEVTTSLDDFDWQKILNERINKLDPEVQTFVKERLPHVGASQ